MDTSSDIRYLHPHLQYREKVYVYFDPTDPMLTDNVDLHVLYSTKYFVCFKTYDYISDWSWINYNLVFPVITRLVIPDKDDIIAMDSRLVTRIRKLKGIRIRIAPDRYTKYSCKRSRDEILAYVSIYERGVLDVSLWEPVTSKKKVCTIL